MVITEELSKSFGRVKALDGVSMMVPKGISGLIGPNGAGKTTLIHILAGLIKPD
ncbi:MAG: ATP-binding cassette domain-containing protein, partial [Thermoproteota archaeon]